jgi:hypothetical protein
MEVCECTVEYLFLLKLSSESGTAKTNSFKFHAQKTYEKSVQELKRGFHKWKVNLLR